MTGHFTELRSPAHESRLDFLASGWRPWLLLILVCLTFYVPGIATLPPVDRDEARYIQATRQMLESGDYLDIRFQDEARNKKPAGIYWLQAGMVRLLSTPESTSVWPYRLVSLLGALGAVLLTFHYGSLFFDRRTALIGAGFLASSLDLVFEAHVATTDAVLLALGVAAQGALAQAYLASRRGENLGWRAAAIFWIAQGLAILVKGPVVPLLSLLTAGALVAADKRGRWLAALRPLWGLPLLLVIVVPWLYLIEKATHGGFLQESLGHDLLGKVAGGQEGHGAWPLYYLVLAPATFWPGSLFLGLAAAQGWHDRRLAATRFLLAWVVPFWIMIELVPTKLPHYALPLYPALALLAARGLLSYGEEGWHRRWEQAGAFFGITAPAFIWTMVVSVLSAVLLMGSVRLDGGIVARAGGALAIASASAGLGHYWSAHHRRAGPATALVAIALAALVCVPGLGMVLPGLDAIWLSRSAATMVGQLGHPGDRIGVSGYAEPSLVFLLGTDTRMLSPEATADALAHCDIALALVETETAGPFNDRLASLHAAARRMGTVSGFDYSKGVWMRISLFALAPPQPAAAPGPKP